VVALAAYALTAGFAIVAWRRRDAAGAEKISDTSSGTHP
jgi:hypothetical protein